MTKIAAALALVVSAAVLLGGCGSGSVEADFTADPTTGRAPLEVQFTDLSEGDIETWEWDFNNDGAVDSTVDNPKHVFTNPGNYTISLKVTGPAGTAEEVKSGCIIAAACPRFADFKADITEGVGTTAVRFTDLSRGTRTSWAWDFDSDGEVDSTDEAPVYIFTKNGVYSVTLTVTTSDCQDTVTKHDYITISGCGH